MLKKSLLVITGMVMAFAWSAFTAEPHPRLRAAQRLLADAQEELVKADRDFGGHKAKAMEHIHRAQEEITRAFEFDRR